MGDVPAQVFIDAAKVWARVFFPAEPDEVIAAHAPDIAATPNFRAAVASAYRAGQAATADGPRRWALPDGAEVEEQWTMRYVLNGRWQSAEDGGHVFDSREQATQHLEAWRIHFPTLTYTNVEYLRRQVITMPWELTDATPAADGQGRLTHGRLRPSRETWTDG
jgi:hypothetical protein